MSNYKSPIRIIQTDFRAGEMDETYRMRVDSKAYASGARKLVNMMIHQSGAISRRPGTRSLAPLLNGRTRLVDFEFDADEKYVVGFSDASLRILSGDGVLYVVLGACPWNSVTMWEMNYVQKGDVMLIVHPSFPPKRLVRTGLTNFILTDLVWQTDTSANVLNQPYLKFEQPGVTIGASSWVVGAVVTVTASHAIFNANWVGERIRIYDNELYVSAYVDSTHLTAVVLEEIRKELGPAPLRVEYGSNIIEVTHVLHGLTTGAVVELRSMSGFDEIDEDEIDGPRTITVLDEDHYTFLADNPWDDVTHDSGNFGGSAVYVLTTAQTRDWTEQAWSWRRGFPAAVALHEDRLWMGGSTGAPTFLAGSVIGAYYDFNAGDGQDDESVQGHVSTLTRIRHLVSARQLQIFTETGEAMVETEDGMPITPGTLKVVTHTSYGSAGVPPELFDGATIFVQRSGRNVREFSYDYQTDAQVSAPVSILASHLINRPHDMAVLYGSATRPEQYAFFVNADGTVAVFHSIRSEELAAWTQFVSAAGGRFDSVCVLGNVVYFSVLRGSSYYLERLELDADNIWLDSCTVETGPGTVFDVGPRLSGQTVQVMSLTGNKFLGSFAVVSSPPSNTITVPDTVDGIVAGYDYGVYVVPMSPDKELQDGPMTGEIRRIVSATLHFHQSANALVNGQELLGFTIGQDPSLPVPLISGKKKIRLLGYNRDPGIVIQQAMPGPLTVLGTSLEVSL